MKTWKKKLLCAAALFAAFLTWTAAVCLVDVQPIGPQGTRVGLAGMNALAHRATGVHMSLYVLTDWLSILPVALCACFGALGLWQWIRRGKLLAVDHSLLALDGFYIAVAAAYLFFECVVINVRPVLIDGRLETSYPSSTTMLVLCVMSTAMMQANMRLKNPACRKYALLGMGAFTALMVLGRLISGVHWLSDIVGGALLSAALVTLYSAACTRK